MFLVAFIWGSLISSQVLAPADVNSTKAAGIDQVCCLLFKINLVFFNALLVVFFFILLFYLACFLMNFSRISETHGTGAGIVMRLKKVLLKTKERLIGKS